MSRLTLLTLAVAFSRIQTRDIFRSRDWHRRIGWREIDRFRRPDQPYATDEEVEKSIARVKRPGAA